jgi:hypothetical protein
MKSCRNLFKENGLGLLHFSRAPCKKFQCYLLKTSTGFRLQVGDMIIHVTEHSIVATYGFPVKGERWFKKGRTPCRPV